MFEPFCNIDGALVALVVEVVLVVPNPEKPENGFDFVEFKEDSFILRFAVNFFLECISSICSGFNGSYTVKYFV